MIQEEIKIKKENQTKNQIKNGRIKVVQEKREKCTDSTRNGEEGKNQRKIPRKRNK